MPGSLQMVSSFFVFANLDCVIFFTMVSVRKARQARLLKSVNKHFHNFVGQKQRKTKSKNGMKSSYVQVWLLDKKEIVKFVFKSLAHAARYKDSNFIFIKVKNCIYSNSNVQSEIQLLHGI